MSTVPSIENRIGVNANGDNTFRGLSVTNDISNKLDYWSLLALSVGGKPMSDDESRYFEQLMLAMNSSDPHIWPLKLVWLAAGYGQPFAGLASIVGAFPGALLGPASIEQAADAIVEFMQLEEEDVASHLETRFPGDELIPGFGVIGREFDERARQMERICVEFGYDKKPCFTRMLQVRTLLGKKGIEIHVSGMIAVLLNDLGFCPQQSMLMASTGLWTSMVANSIDAAEIQPPVLRNLPQSSISYTGKSRRYSERANNYARLEVT